MKGVLRYQLHPIDEETCNTEESNNLPKVTPARSCRPGTYPGKEQGRAGGGRVTAFLTTVRAAPHCKNFLVRRALNIINGYSII